MHVTSFLLPSSEVGKLTFFRLMVEGDEITLYHDPMMSSCEAPTDFCPQLSVVTFSHEKRKRELDSRESRSPHSPSWVLVALNSIWY